MVIGPRSSSTPTAIPALATLDSYVHETMARLHPSSAAILVSRGERVIHERYVTGSFAGMPPSPINAESLFPLASVTKAFTAGVLMALVDRGRVDLDAPIATYLPEMARPGTGPHSRAQVTLRHLASHTSGLQYPRNEPDGPIGSVEAITAPGHDFCYSETGMNVLQAVLEAATGQPWQDLLQTLLLDPLDLTSTRYIRKLDPALALVPARAGDFADPADHYFFTRARGLTGSGLYAPAREVNRYSQAWAQHGTVGGKRLFSAEQVAAAARPHAMLDASSAAYGLLWWVFPAAGALVMSGATHTVSAIVPATATVVTVMRNFYGDLPAGFRFAADKQRLVDLAVSIGRAHVSTP